jgi:hypothetical protein
MRGHEPFAAPNFLTSIKVEAPGGTSSRSTAIEWRPVTGTFSDP